MKIFQIFGDCFGTVNSKSVSGYVLGCVGGHTLLMAGETNGAELKRKNAELESKNAELERKNGELERKNAGLERKNSELERKNAGLEKKNSELEQEHTSSVLRLILNYYDYLPDDFSIPTPPPPSRCLPTFGHRTRRFKLARK